MPTLDDLRTVLRDGEQFAGDPAAVFRAFDDRRAISTPSRHRRPARRYVLAAVASAAAVAALAVGIAAITQTSPDASPPLGHSVAPGTSGTAHAAPAPTVVQSPAPTTATSTSAQAARWGFTVASIPGYTFAYVDDRPDRSSGQQNGALTSTTSPARSATITVYAPGAFNPAQGGVDGRAVQGQTVIVDGHPGTFVAGPSTPMLFWTYGNNSWASVGVSGTKSDDALTFALKVAQSVQIGPSMPITMPFQVAGVPAPLKIVDIAPGSEQATIFYGTSFGTADGIYLTITRMSAARARTLKYLPATDGRTITRTLSDGSILRLTVEPDHVNKISQSQLQTIADQTDVAPTLADPSTWLPVQP